MIAVRPDKGFAVLRLTNQHVRIVRLNKGARAESFSQMMIRFGALSITQSRVQTPVGPAPMMRTVSSCVISEMRAAQKPVARMSPTNSACSSVTLSGILFSS